MLHPRSSTYAQTWVGRTITAKISPDRPTGIVKMQIGAKTGIPTIDQHHVTKGRILMDNIPLKEYGLSGGETIEMTTRLLGGMKQESQSKTDGHRKRTKRKECEPCVDVGGLEDKNLHVNPDEELADTKKWMTDTIGDLRQRTDEVSDLEGSVFRMQWDMEEVKGAFTRVNESPVKMTEGNEARENGKTY